MANKLFVVLFAAIAVQAALAGTIPKEIEEVMDLIVNDEDNLFLDSLPLNLLSGDVEALGDPQNCVPHVQEAYDTAVEVRRIIGEAKVLGKKLIDELIRCRGLTDSTERWTCRKDAVVQAGKEGKALVEAWKKIRPKITEVFEKFTKCLA